MEYEYNGNTNGIFYYLGTKGLTPTWVNPGKFIIFLYFLKIVTFLWFQIPNFHPQYTAKMLKRKAFSRTKLKCEACVLCFLNFLKLYIILGTAALFFLNSRQFTTNKGTFEYVIIQGYTLLFAMVLSKIKLSFNFSK